MIGSLISLWIAVQNAAESQASDPLSAACLLVTLVAAAVAIAGIFYIAWAEFSDWRARRKVKTWQT